MKKIALFLVLSMLLLPLCGCGSAEKSGIAFICSSAGVEDRYEGQALKTAIFAYCTEKGLPYREYISDDSADYVISFATDGTVIETIKNSIVVYLIEVSFYIVVFMMDLF